MKTQIAFLLTLLAPLLLALSAGDLAPDISGKNQDGKLVHLSDYKGKFLLLYFYPKDETPGCTTEACSLRDQYATIKSMNATVLGVSRQDEKSHQEFKAKHKLPFDLLVDTDGAIGKAFAVGSIQGKNMSLRQSFLISPEGKIMKYYPDVDPAEHTKEIISDIQKAKH
jgi:peroxiredoxin Q/BCP